MHRREGLAKLTGRERYVDDLPLDDFWWGMTVRSPVPRGRVTAVRFGADVDWSAFVIVDHRDIPGPNEVILIERDQPVLAAGYVRHVHEPVVLLGHRSREGLRRAVRAVEVVVAPEPPVLDFRVPPRPDQIQYGRDNVLKRLKIEKGDVERALAQAPVVVSGTYETGAQEHVYLETQGMIAWLEDQVLVVKGSMQCPYYVLSALKHALARDESRVRVIQTPTGGGFGGKEEYPSDIALHAALLALKAGRPVKIVYDRGEDMAATTKRHPSWVRHRTGLTRDGRLLAQDLEVVLDGGAYVTLSPVVLSRGIIHADGPYSCDNVRIAGRVMFTNAVPFGAFRGFGAPQTLFACERHMDVIARTLEIDPVELRRINLLRDGQTTATGQVIRDGTDRVAVLERALELSDYRAKRRAHPAFNATHAAVRGASLRAAIVRWHREHAAERLVGDAVYERPPGISWDDANYRGDAYGAFAWATYVAEVEVDLATYSTRVTGFVAVQEVGKVLNETLARGQVQGGVVQGIGWALMEECKFRDGAMINNQLTNYLIPTSDDVPPIHVAFLENPYPHGAQGAKGLGELPIDGPAPAVLNAVAAATGADPRAVPLTPERLMAIADFGLRSAE